jgi:2-dehydro-3-deoxy-D-arabinonate dehydratase
MLASALLARRYGKGTCLRIVRYWDPDAGRPALGCVQADRVFSLAALLANQEASLEVLLRIAEERRLTPAALIKQSSLELSRSFFYEELDLPPDPGKPHLLQSVVSAEVWAAGVTYERSRQAREAESEVADIYERVYDAERPEIFFKATPSRCVGPNQPLGLRGDSRWIVPEPELALILDRSLRIVGFTLGNDMSCRDIEGENPLYLPQAKVFTNCCSLGPAVLLAESDVSPEFVIECRILREGKVVFQGTVSTKQMHRRFEDLVRFLGRCNTFAGMTTLLTGTGIVPPNDFSLRAGDIVEISSPSIGVLRNPVEALQP